MNKKQKDYVVRCFENAIILITDNSINDDSLHNFSCGYGVIELLEPTKKQFNSIFIQLWKLCGDKDRYNNFIDLYSDYLQELENYIECCDKKKKKKIHYLNNG